MRTYSFPGPNDARQTTRTQSYLLAAATNVLALLLMLAWYWLGMLRDRVFGLILVTTLLLLAFIAWLFHAGRDQRRNDAGLTLAQMVAASAALLGAAYAADAGRAVFLVLLVMVCLFGALCLRIRTLMIHALCIVAGYAAVIGLLHRFRPQALDLRLELVNLFVFGVSMPWFALMAGYVSELRERLRKAFRTVAESERTLAEAQRLAQLGSWTFDPERRETVWSAETCRILGLDPEERAIQDADFHALLHEEDRERYLRLIDETLVEGREFDTEYRVSLPSGEVRWMHALARPIVRVPGEGRMLRGMVMDITRRKNHEDQIRRLAHFDALTGLPNRNLLMQLLRHAVDRARHGAPLALLFIDLDGFKAVNDSLGHEVGDALLAAFAQRLGGSLRLSDTAARLGGDEFVVVVEDVELHADIDALAERILISATTPFRVNGHDCRVSASIGIARYGPACADADLLVKAADTAMYAAKRGGKNGFRFHEPVAPA
ncbi:diguanylate cyclase domain-containing protein [Variovorax sp. PvP013]|jgi:diguanylate cyclase (GGDEF)-like protein/PAS domain S-box-containing protein|uniref:diguanylate cyclase domain-containing protein n=1 Tax=Variovorax sp. PvP013 TaxID=3156435 RepID=UPI003D246546